MAKAKSGVARFSRALLTQRDPVTGRFRPRVRESRRTVRSGLGSGSVAVSGKRERLGRRFRTPRRMQSQLSLDSASAMSSGAAPSAPTPGRRAGSRRSRG